MGKAKGRAKQLQAKLVGVSSLRDVPCPTCGAPLPAVGAPQRTDVLWTRETREMMSMHHADYRPYDYEGRFTTAVKCAATACGEPVVLSGRVTVGQYEHQSEDGYLDWDWEEHLVVTYIDPHIQLFEIPDELPSEVVEELDAASRVVWLDSTAAANALRRALECFMDAQGVPETAASRKTGKAERLDLHHRLERFKTTHEEAGKVLLAAKVVGNQGSHKAAQLPRDRLLGLFDDVSWALRKVYDLDEDEKRQARAEETIRNKGFV